MKNLFEIDNRPEEFSHLSENAHRFFELRINGERFGFVSYGAPVGMTGLHTHIETWSPKKAAAMRSAFYFELVPEMREKGIGKIIVSKEFIDYEDAEKWRKFIRLVGFNRPRLVLISDQEI